MEKRLDLLLVEQYGFSTRAQAQDAVKEGRIQINGRIVTKNAYRVGENDIITCQKRETAFASRAGFKLYHALKSFSIDMQARIVLDIGASTGGFSDVCLQQGASYVYAVDVGRDQLIERLKNDPRVCSMEGINCRYLSADMFDPQPDFVCIDVSFISLQLILPAAFAVVKEPFDIVALIKPQFEAGKQHIDKHGIVKNKKVHISVLQDMTAFIKESGYGVHHLTASSITGRDGNQEYLVHIRKETGASSFDYQDIVNVK